MDLSVVVATLNGRDALEDCLDALAEAAPEAERVVVNGPSVDGTTGMVKSRDDVEMLLELADRNVNAARNAGAAVATGEVVAFVDERTAVGADWVHAVDRALDGSAVATGPVRRPLPVGSETSRPRRERFRAREVTFFHGANVAFRREALGAIDGFDEYLEVGGARDAAHRLAALEVDVAWSDDLQVRRATPGAGPDPRDAPGRKYRSLAYRLVKNYGVAPDALKRVFGSARADGGAELRAVLRGECPPSQWIGDGAEVAGAVVRGAFDGARARIGDRRPARNPNGISSRDDRVVRRYEWA